MTWEVILAAIDSVGVVVHTADNREEDRGVTGPELRVGLPQIFLTVCVFNTLELCSLLRYDDGELFVF
jgi:hypothetical protein